MNAKRRTRSHVEVAMIVAALTLGTLSAPLACMDDPASDRWAATTDTSPCVRTPASASLDPGPDDCFEGLATEICHEQPSSPSLYCVDCYDFPTCCPSGDPPNEPLPSTPTSSTCYPVP